LEIATIEALDALEVITLFVEDLPAARTFYQSVFGRKIVYQDDNCSVMELGSVMINLLRATEAPTLVAPVAVATPSTGPRFLLTIKVEDVDAVCAALANHGVTLLSGPLDRPWGRRTAAFADPAGHVWEVAQELPRA